MTAQNPYQAPLADDDAAVLAPGDFTIGGTLSEAFELTKQYFPLWLGVGFVGTLLTALAAITIIGYFVVVPVIMWGLTKFLLNMVDGRPEMNDLFAGFKDYGSKLLSTLGLFLCFGGLVLLGDSIAIAGQLAGSEIVQSIGGLVYMVFTFTVVVRFYFAMFFLVDQRMGAVESMSASWAATRGKTGKLIGFAIVTGFLAMAGLLALIIGVFFTLMMSYVAYAVAYRKMAGPSHAR